MSKKTIFCIGDKVSFTEQNHRVGEVIAIEGTAEEPLYKIWFDRSPVFRSLTQLIKTDKLKLAYPNGKRSDKGIDFVQHPVTKGTCSGGRCNRTACNNMNAWWYNNVMHRWYCEKCVRNICDENRDMQSRYGGRYLLWFDKKEEEYEPI